MKLENLFALYLYQFKTLNLPGIGVFTADKTVTVPDDNEKHPTPVQGITFTNKNVLLPDDDFINFIKTHTGKMKPLAISDLESYLMLSKQFLNIGKPFYLEGIGTLQKINDGSLKFTPGDYASTRLDPPIGEKASLEKKTRSAFADETKSYNTVGNNASRKMLLLLLGLGTILLVGWGGYYLFKSNTGAGYSEDGNIDTVSAITTLPQDNPGPVLLADSAAVKDSTARISAGTYKYILESTANRKRALRRFNDLSSFRNGIQMETKDSVLFNIYVIKPSAPSDTTRLKDSLNAWYYGTREMKVRIQQ